MTARVHPTAAVADGAVIGDRTQIWLHCQIRQHVRIGEDCILGKNIYVETGVRIGDRCKIQNNVSVFAGVTLEDGVFVGPHVCFTNDRVPRAVNPTARSSRRPTGTSTRPGCAPAPRSAPTRRSCAA